jgi:hypothetical protein
VSEGMGVERGWVWRTCCNATVARVRRLMGPSPLLQRGLSQVLGDVHGDVEEGEIGDGQALALEAGKASGEYE